MTRRAVDFVKCTRRGCETRGKHCHPVFQPVIKKEQSPPKPTETWTIRRSHHNTPFMFEMINEGWEPFSVTLERNMNIIWLRKKG